MSELIVSLGYFDLPDLLDLRPSGGYYLHSSSEPFSEEQTVDFARFKRWLEYFELEYRCLHASGHCSREEIFKLVERSGAEKVFPVHTKGPRLFKEVAERVYEQIELGKAYEI